MTQEHTHTQLPHGVLSRTQVVHAAARASAVTAAIAVAPPLFAGVSRVEAAAMQGGDLGILNYALTLEHFEDALYRTLISSGLLTGTALQYAMAFGAHEHAHVVALTATIQKLGGMPVAEQAHYNFPVLKTAAQVVQTLIMVEDLGASAYLGAAPLVQNPAVLTAAVEIHTVEAEHATAWRLLGNVDVVPFAFAPGSSMKEVLAAVTPFL